MSAFIVGKPHIDALVHAAAAHRVGEHHSGMSWYHFTVTDDQGWPADMRRYEVGYSDQESQDECGRMLWAENLRSIEYRYPDTIDNQMYPGPGGFLGWPDVEQYTCKGLRQAPDPVAILKAIECYEYQSCEHPGWRTSNAQAFCENLRRKMIVALPGYREADWEVES